MAATTASSKLIDVFGAVSLRFCCNDPRRICPSTRPLTEACSTCWDEDGTSGGEGEPCGDSRPREPALSEAEGSGPRGFCAGWLCAGESPASTRAFLTSSSQ